MIRWLKICFCYIKETKDKRIEKVQKEFVREKLEHISTVLAPYYITLFSSSSLFPGYPDQFINFDRAKLATSAREENLSLDYFNEIMNYFEKILVGVNAFVIEKKSEKERLMKEYRDKIDSCYLFLKHQ